MPFPNPLFPSEFSVGDPTKGHVHFDAAGATFYGADGVTPVFRYDAATGTVTIVGKLTARTASGASIVIDPVGPAIELPSGNAGEVQAARIQATSSGAGGPLGLQLMSALFHGAANPAFVTVYSNTDTANSYIEIDDGGGDPYTFIDGMLTLPGGIRMPADNYINGGSLAHQGIAPLAGLTPYPPDAGGTYNPFQVYEDAAGTLHLRGLMNLPTPMPANGTVIGVLPVGRRPSNYNVVAPCVFMNASTGMPQAGRVNILAVGSPSPGNIALYGAPGLPAGSLVSLDSISWSNW